MTGLDWRGPQHWGGGRRLPCRLCGRPAFCRDDEGLPAHKACAELAADEHTEHADSIAWGTPA